MKRVAWYLGLILLAVAVEATIPALPGLHAVRPMLHVALVLFFSLRLNTIEGAALSFVCGTLVDATVPYPSGLAAFTDVSLFVAGRVVLAGVRSEGAMIESLFSFLMTALFHAMTWSLRRLFGPPMTSLDGTPWLHAHLIACVATAACTPLVFRAARRIELIDAKPPGALT